MQTIIVNGQEFDKFRCVSTQKRGINNTVGVLIQLEVFRDGEVMDKKDVKGYLMEKIEEYIREWI